MLFSQVQDRGVPPDPRLWRTGAQTSVPAIGPLEVVMAASFESADPAGMKEGWVMVLMRGSTESGVRYGLGQIDPR